MKVENWFLMLLEVEFFQLKQHKGKEWQYLTPKQMIQILPEFTKFTKWNQTNYIFFVSNKENYWKSIPQCNEFNKVIKQNEDYIYEF